MSWPTIQPYQYVALRLPSDNVKVEQIIPNSIINLGKYGSFRSNGLLGRPFYLTFEILDRSETSDGRELRVISAAELNTDALTEPSEDGEDFFDDIALLESKSNVNIIDDPSNQKLTMADIETLKQAETGNSRDLIAKIMESHSALDQKTAFSLAKYTLRKHRKYLKRFCVLPLDVPALADWMMSDRDFQKVMEIRNEILGLVGCWANVHAAGLDHRLEPTTASSRYLVVDDTGGLVVAALAERLGILHPANSQQTAGSEETPPYANANANAGGHAEHPRKPRRVQEAPAMGAQSDCITLIHANQQPNLALLRYFGFDSNNPTSSHPLYSHLKTLSWLQLVDPAADSATHQPSAVSAAELAAYKPSKRSTYYRKWRRWDRITAVINDTQGGGFNGLVVASFTNAVSILHRLVPLLAGGSQVVVYSPHIEPLTELADLYSTARRTAFLMLPDDQRQVPSEDYPVDPTLLLVPMVQTARVRKWQVLPGRTHPLMMGRGGAEGYVFVATRVLPIEGKVTARGRPPRRKHADVTNSGMTTPRATENGEPEAKKPKTETAIATVQLGT